MSYCRWSTDGFACDVYVYESSHAFVCHVASNRIKGRAPTYWWPDITEDEFNEAYAKYGEFMDNVERESIDHPAAGETYYTDDAGEMAEVLITLKRDGFNVPQHVIDTLNQESKDGL